MALKYLSSGEDKFKKKTLTLEMCKKLCDKADLWTTCGRALYTDDYYTLVKLAKYVFEKCG